MIISDLAVSRDQGSQTLFRTWVEQTQCLGEKERKREKKCVQPNMMLDTLAAIF